MQPLEVWVIGKPPSQIDLDEKTFGKKEVVCDIIATLTNSNNQEKYLLLMAAVGMPGLGKTTLAKSIFYNKRDIDRYFDKKIWVCVS